MPADYRYPDPGDRVTKSLIAQREPFRGYWRASEQRALALVGDLLAEHLGPRAGVRALDAGCGDGRLLKWIAKYAADITAADPDAARLTKARAVALPAGTNTTFQQAPIAGIAGSGYDLAICSHIVQHMPTGDVEPALHHLHDVAAPGALLMLSYSRAPVGHGAYMLDRREEGEVRHEPVDRARFDKALTTGARTGVLPVRLIDPQAFGKEVAAAGWTLCWERTYHVLDDFGVLDSHIDRDDLVNAHPELLHLGRDIVTLWRRAGRPA